MPSVGNPTTLSNPNPGMIDPFGRNQTGIVGRLIPNPSTRMPVDLYENGMRLDTAFTEPDGTFRFPRQSSGRRYEIRITVGADQEFREDVDFNQGLPAIVHMNNPRSIHITNPGKIPAGGVISVANLTAPKKAQQEVEKGRELAMKHKFEESLTHLQKAVEIHEKYPEAYQEMGKVHRAMNHLPEAEEMFRKAIEADPHWTPPYMDLAQLQMSRNQIDDMMKTSARLLAVDPALGAPHYYNAVGYFTQGRMEDAEKEGLAADKDAQHHIPQVNLILARLYEVRGNNADAVTRYQLYLKEAPNAPNAAKVSEHLAELQKK